jgi:hypothetical protein
MLLGDSDGNKYSPFLVFKTTRSKSPGRNYDNWRERNGFGIHVWKKAKAIMESSSLLLYANPTAWWNEDVHIEFLAKSYGTRSRPWMSVLLLIDDFSGHWTSKCREFALSIDVHMMKVPPSHTSVCQPADVA